MAMSEEEKSAYLAEIDGPINEAVDAAMMKLYGKTYREAPITHSEKNGDSSHVPTDSWQQIKADFPDLFGGNV
jgi:hypothetical protein